MTPKQFVLVIASIFLILAGSTCYLELKKIDVMEQAIEKGIPLCIER